MPIQFLDDAEPQVRFTDDTEGGTTGHIKFLDEPAPAIAPQVEEQQLKSLTADQFEALSPHEKARKMSRLEELQFAPLNVLSPIRGESIDVARARKAQALPEEQLKFEQEAAPHNLREHVELARARPSSKTQYWLDRMMFSPTKGAQSLEVLNSAKNISAGVADAKDYEQVSSYLVAAERAKEQGIFADVGDTLSAMPAYMAEFAMTGGAYSGTKEAAQRAGLVAVEQAVSKAVARNVGSRLARGAINRAAQAPATAIGIGAQVAANPQQIANNLADHELSGLTFQKGDEGTIETVLKQDDKGFLTNLRNAYVKAGFELGSERAGELLTPLKAAIARRWLSVPGRTPGKLKATLDSAGWHGVLGEMFEERVNELGAPLYGENYQPPTWRQLVTEAISFSVPGAVNRLTSGRVSEKEQNATTTRKADEVLDSGTAPARVPADGQDRASDAAGQSARPENSFSDLIPSSVPVVPVPEAAPGPVAAKSPLAVRILTARGVAPDVAEFVAARAGDKPANETAEDYRARVNGLHDEFGFKVPTEVNQASSEASLRAAAQAEGFTEEQIQNTLSKAREADMVVSGENSFLIGRIKAARQAANVRKPPEPIISLTEIKGNDTTAKFPEGWDEARLDAAMNLKAELRAVMSAKPGPISVARVKERVKELPVGLQNEVLADVANYEASLNKPTTTSAPPADKVGDAVRIMGVDSVVAKTETVGGVRYDLFNGAKLKEKKAAVRITDQETGNTVTIKQYPNFDKAEAEFNRTLDAAKGTKPAIPETIPPAAETKAQVAVTPERLSSPLTLEQIAQIRMQATPLVWPARRFEQLKAGAPLNEVEIDALKSGRYSVPDELLDARPDLFGPKRISPPTATPAGKTPRRTAEERPHDLIDEIEGTIGHIDPKLIRESDPNWQPTGAARKIFRAGGTAADRALQSLTYEGDKLGVTSGMSLDDFGHTINAVAGARQGFRGAQRRNEKAIIAEGKQGEEFQKRVIAGERPKTEAANVERVPVDGLIVGDKFTVQGHEFEVQKLEFDDSDNLTGIVVKDGAKFGVQTISPGQEFIHIANKIADSLENLRLGKPGETTDFIYGMTKLVWNGALDAAKAVIRAGGTVADAVAKAIAYIRANHKGDWDEAGARTALETASAAPAATEQGVTEPAEGEQPPVVDDQWVETKVKGVSWWVRDRDRLSPESTARSITVAEAAFTEAGFESERRTMFDTGDHQTKSILFIPETENADEKGRKLAEVLEREISTQREEGKGADHVSTLINSVREGYDQPGSAFRQMRTQVRNRLFALAHEEASWRGRALRALANSKADLIRVSRNVDVYLQRIYSKAFSGPAPGGIVGGGDITDDLRRVLREVLTEEEIDNLKGLLQKPEDRERIKAALKKALAKVDAKGARRFGRKNWRTIESLIEGGILDDTEWFKELARKRGWKVPTDAEIEQMRKLADEEQTLRQPTDAELAKASDNPLARERLLADIEAATRESRFKLQKRLAVMWSEMTKPVSMRHYWTQRQNTARFLNELMTANLLFRASFVTKQAIDVSTQWFWRMPMRAVAQALTLRHNDLAKGQQVQFWDDAQAALKDIYGDSIKSLKVAGTKARAALAGRVEIRNVDRLMGSVSALDRLWLRADRAAEAGNNAEAFMWRAVAAIGFSYKVAGAFDYLHGTPAEWNERRFRVIEAIRETGVDPATARVQAEWVMDKTLAEYPEAVAMTRSMLEARGIPFTEQQLGEDAWNMVERRQYQRISELGLPVDAIQEQAELYRNVLGWNEREMRGPGGLAGVIVQGVGAIGEGIGIPLAMGRFGNAIAIGINRQLHKTPLYALADIRLPFLRGGQAPSPWSRTMTDIYERRLEAVAGTMLGSTMLALAAGGLLKVWLKPPPDKEERELWEREGHKAGTVEIPLGDGRYSVWSLTAGPFALVAPYLAAGGAINDLTVKREKQQAKLNADAARRGLTPAKLPPPDISDWLGVAAQAAQASILGNRTASGLFYSVTDYGTPNVKKFLAAQFTPLVPGLPALQEVSRMSGVIIDPKKADIIDFLVPLPTSKARKYNMLGDPVGTPDDVQRVIQTLTGGSYPVISPGAAREADAYKALFATGYRPPSIDPNAGHAIGGDFRPFTSSELEQYTAARSKNLREELGRLGPAADLKDAREAYQRANTAALREVGVTVAPKAETSANGRAAIGGTRPSTVGGTTGTSGSLTGLGGRGGNRALGRGRLSRGLRFGRRRGLSRASRIRSQPRIGRGRRLRGLSRVRRAA